MYICNKCGSYLEELPTERYCHEELDERPYVSIDIWDCPCGGDFEEAVQCDCCTEWFLEEQLENGWCQACIDENTTIESMLCYINEDIELQNEFYVNAQFGYWIYDNAPVPSEILNMCRQRFESILKFAYLSPPSQSRIEEMLREFISNDPSHFQEWLTTEWQP